MTTAPSSDNPYSVYLPPIPLAPKPTAEPEPTAQVTPAERELEATRDTVEEAVNRNFPLVPKAIIATGFDLVQVALTSEAVRQRQAANVGAFRAAVGERAAAKLDGHRAQVNAERARLLGPGGAAARAQLRGRLREAQAARRDELAARAAHIAGYSEYALHPLDAAMGAAGDALGLGAVTANLTYSNQQARAKAVTSAAARVAAQIEREPALGALDLATLDPDMSDAELEAALAKGLNDAERAIDDVQQRIERGEIPLMALGKVTQESLHDMGITAEKAAAGDALSHDVLQYLEEEGNAEATMNYALSGVMLTASVAGFIVGGPVGAAILGGAAAGGVAHGAIKLDEALDQRAAAYVGLERDDGLADEDEADLAVAMAAGEVAMGVIDAGTAVGFAKGAAGAARAARQAEAIAARTERAAARPVRPTDPTDVFPAAPRQARLTSMSEAVTDPGALAHSGAGPRRAGAGQARGGHPGPRQVWGSPAGASDEATAAAKATAEAKQARATAKAEVPAAKARAKAETEAQAARAPTKAEARAAKAQARAAKAQAKAQAKEARARAKAEARAAQAEVKAEARVAKAQADAEARAAKAEARAEKAHAKATKAEARADKAPARDGKADAGTRAEADQAQARKAERTTSEAPRASEPAEPTDWVHDPSAPRADAYVIIDDPAPFSPDPERMWQQMQRFRPDSALVKQAELERLRKVLKDLEEPVRSFKPFIKA